MRVLASHGGFRGVAMVSDALMDDLKALVGEARQMVGFTGAGISTESGVPDFRSPGSPWMKHHPIDFQSFMRSSEARREAWRRKFTMDDLYRDARPSIGHQVLAEWVKTRQMLGIITQNIDGLHQAAGLADDDVVEIHGNGTYARCLECGERHELPAIRHLLEMSDLTPVCETCGGIVKSATISFGQAMPQAAMRRAQDLSRRCDLFLAIGSSLVVQPAASLPVIAKRAGARLVIINREPTHLDEMADLVVHGEIGAILSPFLPASIGDKI
jgi:NAD-dependent deacetylase